MNQNLTRENSIRKSMNIYNEYKMVLLFKKILKKEGK